VTAAPSMRAAVLAGAGGVLTQAVARPEPGPGQVRVRVEGSGVCASSLPVWEGRPWFTYPALPGEPGHEGWGIVDRVGDGADAGLLGARVSFLSTHAFAEWDVADAGAVVRVPQALDGRDCPGEALACAVNAFERGRVAAGDVVAVVGVGFLGAAIVALAAQAGATVVAFSRRAFARERARGLGAAAVHDLEDAATAARIVAGLTPNGLADVVFEAGGVQATLDLASTLARTGGRLVIAGFHQDGLRSIDLCSWNWRGLDVVNAHERDPGRCVRGMRQAFELVQEGVLDLDALLTHRVDLSDLGQAFTWMRDRPNGFLKAVVTMG
jgi:threonine dehydrogenase-like Zn-dependent dehydrogenase